MVLRTTKEREPDGVSGGAAAEIIALVRGIDRRLSAIERAMRRTGSAPQDQVAEKEWYSTRELAEAMDVSVFTVAERWCNQGRIEAEKDPDRGKWRIPGREYRRLVAGGLRARRRPEPSSRRTRR